MKLFCSERRYRKKKLCACMFNCYSLSALSAHRHYTIQTTPSVCCLPIYTIRHVNK